MSKNLSPDQRLAQIRNQLARLGRLDGWGERIIAVGLWAGGNNDLHDFVMDAPFAVQFLIAVVADQAQEIEQLRRRERALEVAHE